MAYDYQSERHWVFTEDGQVQFLRIRDKAKFLLDKAGAFTQEKVTAGEAGDGWKMMACVDRLVELGELACISPPGIWGQFRVFIKP